MRGRTVRVFAQGSYANRTNVRADSDGDIAVCLTEETSFFSDFTFAKGFTRETLGFTDATYTYSQFKNEVEKALVAYFGQPQVHRGKKAFDIHANTYRVDADAVACFEHRRYTHRGSDGLYYYTSGIQFNPDNGVTIINWPQQNYDNGVLKNDETQRRFKAVVRILKNLRAEMESEGVVEAKPIPSFLIECLVWSVPNDRFGHDEYTDDLREVLIYLYNATKEDALCAEWREVSDLKYLFRASQPWTRVQANAFLLRAWHYLRFT